MPVISEELIELEVPVERSEASEVVGEVTVVESVVEAVTGKVVSEVIVVLGVDVSMVDA